VVAREYALPAVSGIPALRLFRDDEPLLVDGTQGVVVRLEG
ncbi:MAG: PEP-utilizing enzyme, partial [Ardenticatenaceae bacterium]